MIYFSTTLLPSSVDPGPDDDGEAVAKETNGGDGQTNFSAGKFMKGSSADHFLYSISKLVPNIIRLTLTYKSM